jgi:hypothetical protein
MVPLRVCHRFAHFRRFVPMAAPQQTSKTFLHNPSRTSHSPSPSLPPSSSILVRISPILHDLTFRCSIQLPPPARPPRGPGRWPRTRQRRLRQQQSRRAAPGWRPSSPSMPSTSTPWYGTLSSVPCFYSLGHLVFAAMYSLLELSVPCNALRERILEPVVFCLWTVIWHVWFVAGPFAC